MGADCVINHMVSVIIPTYNRGDRIERSIKSVLSQTYINIEVIIIDDGSTDDTRNIINKIDDERIRYFYQENAGACIARNQGIKLVNGEFIAFHDSDDVWYQDKIEKQMEIFENNPNVDLVFCKLVQKRKNGNEVLSPNNIRAGIVHPVEDLFGIGTITLLGKKEVFENNQFDERLPRFQELELLYRISASYTLYCLDQGLAVYNLGEDSISSNPFKMYKACELILDKHPQMRINHPKMVKHMAAIMQHAGRRLKSAHDGQYKMFYDKSLELDHSVKSRLRLLLLNLGLLALDD